MTKAAVVVLAGNESHADHGRVANALEAAKEFAEHGDELELKSECDRDWGLSHLNLSSPLPDSDYCEWFHGRRRNPTAQTL